MFSRARYLAGAVVVGTAVVLAPVVPAQAQGDQQTADGLVNVQVGDVTILENVAVAAAVAAVANICPAVNVSNITALANEVDQRGGSSGAICQGTSDAATGPVLIKDNGGGGSDGGDQQTADGLVNVQVGDVTLLQNVAVGLAAAVVANLCPAVNVSNITALANEVDQRGGSSDAFCNGDAGADSGPVRIVNNR